MSTPLKPVKSYANGEPQYATDDPSKTEQGESMNIKELAEQAGFVVGVSVNADRQIKRFAELVAEAERESCAKLCEKHGEAQVDNYAVHSAYDCAAAIRARENNNG